MASNPYVNKVVVNNTTLIDLTADTVDAAHLYTGYTAHDASGALITGTYAPSSPVSVDPLTVTVNGTYTAPSGHAYSPVTVNVSGGGGEPDYFYIQNLSTSNALIGLKKTGTFTNTPVLSWKIDNREWNSNYQFSQIAVPAGGKLYFKGNNNTFSESASNYISVSSLSDAIPLAIGGNIVSLITESFELNDVPQYAFYGLCMNKTNLYSAANLKLPTLRVFGGGYRRMFMGCSNLTAPPSISATILAGSSCELMFASCTSLVSIPIIHATRLGNHEYSAACNWMFSGCTSLVISDALTSSATYSWTIPNQVLTATQVSMFENCAGTRASDSVPVVSGQSLTYYTQKPPV